MTGSLRARARWICRQSRSVRSVAEFPTGACLSSIADPLREGWRMKFCEKCGSYMRKTPQGLSCVACGNVVQEQVIEVKQITNRERPSVDVVHVSEMGHMRVTETCPRCGNPEAFRSAAFVSGEHAGVRQERSIERLRCTKCLHSWTKD